MQKYYNLFSFLIPTNNPEALKTKFYTCLPVLEIIKFYICLCFNFQSPYTQQDIDKIVTELTNKGFKVYYTYNEYNWTSETFSFITMRNDAAAAAPPDTKYFVDFDDDIIYYPEYYEKMKQVWLNAIYFLLKQPNMGSLRIDTNTFQGKKAIIFRDVKPNQIYYNFTTYGRTGLGLIYKNIYNGNVLPNFLLNKKGSREDLLQIYQRIIDGYLCSFIIVDNYGEHTDHKEKLSRERYGLLQFEQEEGSVMKYINHVTPAILEQYPYKNMKENYIPMINLSEEDLKNFIENGDY